MAPTPPSSVNKVFQQYTPAIRKKLLVLRQLIFDVASEYDEIGAIEETLKWGEPSYLTKNGSTIRISYKTGEPPCYAIYFNCQTKLIDTFKQLYPNQLTFEGNRAIVLLAKNKIPKKILKHCLFLSLTYHKRKHLPLLGA